MNRIKNALRSSDQVFLDALLGLCLFLPLLAIGSYQPAFMVGAALATLPLAMRRRQPLLVYSLILVGDFFTNGMEPWLRIAALLIATYTLGTSRYPLRFTLAAILTPATLALIIFGAQIPSLPAFTGPYVLVGVPWLIGLLVKQQRQKIEAAEEKAVYLETEQGRITQAAVAGERARIARELHDVVAHHVSVMVIQAGAARQVLDSSPEQAKTALKKVESTGREAMSEMRRLVGLLGSDSSLDLAPQPGLGQLEPLIQRVREAGLPVNLRMEGEPCPLPAGIDLAAYRIIQEALTNVLKHAGQAHVDVLLRYEPIGLAMEILDDGNGLSGESRLEGGHGMVGMRERVMLYGGALEAGPRLEHGYQIRVWLPLTGG